MSTHPNTLGSSVPRDHLDAPLDVTFPTYSALKFEAGSHLSDISEFQPNINWGAYGPARHAIVVRVDSGYSPDLRWASHRDGARSSCKVRGWYQYLAPGRDVVAQANRFCDLVGALQPGEFVVLDFEDPGFRGNQVGAALTWFGVIRNRLHTTPNQEWFYSYWPFVGEHFGGTLSWLGGRPSWIAGYSYSVPWWRPMCELWQHTDGQYGDHQCQPAPGIGSDDCSVYSGSIDQLAAFVGGGAPPTPPPKPKTTEDNDMKESYRLLPGEYVELDSPIMTKAVLSLKVDTGGLTPPGAVVRMAMGGPWQGLGQSNPSNPWMPVAQKPNDPGLGPDSFVTYFPDGTNYFTTNGQGGLVVVSNLSKAQAQSKGIDTNRFGYDATVSVSCSYVQPAAA